MSVECLTMPTWSRPRDLILPRLIKPFTLIIFIHPLRFCVVILFTKCSPYIIRSWSIFTTKRYTETRKKVTFRTHSINQPEYDFNFRSTESKSISRRRIFSSVRRKNVKVNRNSLAIHRIIINGTFENRINRLFSVDSGMMCRQSPRRRLILVLFVHLDGASLFLPTPWSFIHFQCRSIIIFSSIKTVIFRAKRRELSLRFFIRLVSVYFISFLSYEAVTISYSTCIGLSRREFLVI